MSTVLIREVGRGDVRQAVTMTAVPLTPEEVGTRIRRAREERKPKPWSQLDLAIALGVSPATIYRWEKGRLPSMTELIRLAELMEIPLDELTEPPEHRTELQDLRDLLAAARIEAERGREALLESLVSIDARLSAIEAQLSSQAPRESHR
jgi:transcriptional regulator with XRE-family HTH domain